MGVSKTQVVKFIRKGAAGENAVSISLLPASVSAKIGTRTHFDFYVEVYDGNTLVQYRNGNDDNGYLCSTLAQSDNYSWNFHTDDRKVFYYSIYVQPSSTAVIDIPFTVTYKGQQHRRHIVITPSAKEVTLRGPQAWSDCATGYAFQAGGSADEFKDVVIYGDNYYSCIKTHNKDANNYPGSTADTNNKYWKLGDKIELVASKILLATYALVKNLGVEAIDMKDANGNVLFQAKDGNVTCKTGTFENVTVKGTLEGVSGSFKSLNCVNNSGNIVGSITFGSDGKMWFDGDMYHQGYNYDKQRSLRFYTSDLWCRGDFGAATRTMLVVYGSYGYYYTKGATNSGTYVAFTSKTSSNNETYYELRMYGTDSDYAGMPVDILVFNINSSTKYRYELVMSESQRVLVVNGNNNQNNVDIYTNGNKTTWNGGEVAEVVKLPNKISPSPGTSKLGRGLLVGAFRDNDWTT